MCPIDLDQIWLGYIVVDCCPVADNSLLIELKPQAGAGVVATPRIQEATGYREIRLSSTLRAFTRSGPANSQRRRERTSRH